jgi:hypothetical protein
LLRAGAIFASDALPTAEVRVEPRPMTLCGI